MSDNGTSTTVTESTDGLDEAMAAAVEPSDEEPSDDEAAEVEWPTMVTAAEDASLGDVLAPNPDTAAAPEGGAGVVDVPLPEPDEMAVHSAPITAM